MLNKDLIKLLQTLPEDSEVYFSTKYRYYKIVSTNIYLEKAWDGTSKEVILLED